MAIDVTDWPEDPEHPRYPEGARDKSALFPPEPLPFDFLKAGRRYLFKLSDRRFPEQYWAETIAYVIGCLLGIDVPPAYIGVHRTHGVAGALIEWFFVDGEHEFVAGGNRLQRLVPDYDRRKGTQHSFQLVQRACIRAARDGLSEDWLLYWAHAFLFDALIGNTDRHQDNWGFLVQSTPDGALHQRLSPLFDNGTSLGMEKHMAHVQGWDDKRCATYVAKGFHHMMINGDDTQRCQHFRMVEYLIDAHPTLKNELRGRLMAFDFDELQRCLFELCRLNVPVPLTEQRVNFLLTLTKLRYERLCEILS
ncbi:HipA domain-containing protein [Caballeronia sp. NCTM1]|uniref:HipA domain-containing protein n=1 Tax=Caballeronia sp. NCTM1 TaxID=2921753 RepID=UPI002028E75B